MVALLLLPRPPPPLTTFLYSITSNNTQNNDKKKKTKIYKRVIRGVYPCINHSSSSNSFLQYTKVENKTKNRLVIRVSDPINNQWQSSSSRLSLLLFDPVPLIPLTFLNMQQQQQQQNVQIDDDGDDDEMKKKEDREYYYVNMGYAIRTLRDEFPHIFNKAPAFDIYSSLCRDDVVFKDPLNTFTGIDNYKRILWVSRFIGRMFFKSLWIDIVRIWQPSDNVVMIRWRVNGIPRVPWESYGRFDGISEYKLDRSGKIYEHRVDNIVPPSNIRKYRGLSVNELVRSLGCPSTPNPTYFETSSTSFLFAVTCAACCLTLHLLPTLQ